MGYGGMVRRYMEAQMKQPLNIEALAQAIHASKRGVVYRHLTPAEYEELDEVFNVTMPPSSQMTSKGLRRCAIRLINADKLLDELRK